LTLGFLTSLSAFLVHLNFASRRERAPICFHGGDGVAIFLSLLLAFSPAGSALSMDVHFGLDWGPWQPSVPPVASRIMQLFVCFVYLRTFHWKVIRTNWMDGTALFRFVFRNVHARQMPLVVRTVRVAIVSRIGTWGALCLEGLLPFAFWFR